MAEGKILVGIDNFADDEWKVVIGGMTDEIDITEILNARTNNCIIEFDELQNRYIISHKTEKWTKKIALKRMISVAEVMYGFIVPQAVCSAYLSKNIQ